MAIPSRGLLVTANEADLVEDGLARSHVMIFERGEGAPQYPTIVSTMVDGKPIGWGALSGLAVEYRIVQLYSRVKGKREAKLAFDVGQGTQDLGFKNELNVLFEAEPAVSVTLDVLDDDGTPTTGPATQPSTVGPNSSPNTGGRTN